MNCIECKDLFCKHRSQNTIGGQCFYELKGQTEKLLAITTETTFAHIDWSTFRREAAKQMLPITSNWKLTKADCTASIPIRKEAACKLAIEYADELIKQLKEEQK